VSHRIPFLALSLEGALQSWGERARWSVRDTANEPTKSGIVGLLAACLGWGSQKDGDIAELARTITLGIRIDRPGRALIDFHTVGGGRPPTGVMSAERHDVVKRTGKIKEPETITSRRAYLADASFLAVVGGPSDVLDRLARASNDPIWPPFLGRKSCPPSIPLRPVRLEARDLESALAQVPLRLRPSERPTKQLRAVVEVPPGAPLDRSGLHTRRQDVPLSLVYRQFGFRTVRETLIDVASLPKATDFPEGH
jgi:CRISPR system Cascade subunit CasD